MGQPMKEVNITFFIFFIFVSFSKIHQGVDL